MKISETVGKFDLRDSKPFFNFIEKWIDYVTSKKRSADITDIEWNQLFGSKNPVAGINWARLDDTYKTRTTNEKKSIIDNWDSSIRPFIEDTFAITDPSSKKAKIKQLQALLHSTIINGGGRDRSVAINRILITFFPDCFVRIPNYEDLKTFIELLNKYIENGGSIVITNNWIDDCYQVKKFFDNELNDDHLTASAWRFYEYIQENHTTGATTIVSTPTQPTMDTHNNYDAFLKLLKGNYNLILTGAPGTGKTYLAKEIAKAMGATYKVVQFHPSYDYTDFVEGLRPIKSGSSLGFQRKDGVFKAFCKEALKSNAISVDEALAAFHSDLKKGGISIKSHKSNTFFEVRLANNNYKIFTSSRNCPKDGYNCSFEAVRNYIVTGDYIEGHQTYQPSIGEYVKENYMTSSTSSTYVFIIDEINRGEISKIFGELFLSIDTGYRGEEHKVDTQYQNLIPREGDPDFDPSNADVFRNGFFIPENVFIIGTMNDIDRSVESMDFAMRRRFAWKEITAKSRQSMLDEEGAWGAKGKPSDDIIEEMKNRMDNLNAAIIDQYGDEALSNKDKIGLSKAYQIGASYFLKYSLYNNFDDLWTNHIEGLLYEYLRGKTNIDEKIERLHQAYNDSTKH